MSGVLLVPATPEFQNKTLLGHLGSFGAFISKWLVTGKRLVVVLKYGGVLVPHATKRKISPTQDLLSPT